MAKKKSSETNVKRVTAKSDRPAKKQTKTTKKSEIEAVRPAEVTKPKVGKYAAKVSGKKAKKPRKPLPKFLQIVLSPFAAIGRYFASAWQELKLVRWPTRAETWKMTGAVLVFSLVFTALILLLDMLFNWLFKTILG